MLVLTRKREQSVQIGRHVTVTILRVKGGAVRIGIQAPPDVKILRGELPELPVSDELGEAAASAPAQPSGAGASPDPARARRASNPNPNPDAADDASAPADRPPGLTDPRRPALRRGPAAPGFPAAHPFPAARCGASTLPAMTR